MIAVNAAAAIALWKFICAHQVIATSIATTIAGWMFSAYVTVYVTTPPGPSSSRLYAWWYIVMHSAAANLDKLKGTR